MSLENATITVTQEAKITENFMANYPNIRRIKGYLEGIWDFSLFNHCFPKNNKLSDVDSSIELEGHTLHIEFKGAKNGMNKGQLLKAIRQAKHSNITTMFIFGKRNKPEAYFMILPDAESERGYKNTAYTPTNLEGVCDIFIRWCAYAQQNSLAENKTQEWNEVNRVLASLYK